MKVLKYSLNKTKSNSLLHVAFLIAFFDFLSIIISAGMAVQFRFGRYKTYSGRFDANLNYGRTVFLISFLWFIFLVFSGIYKPQNSLIARFNIRLVYRKSFLYFFFIGFLSFIVKASFSRIVFLTMIFVGLLNITLLRVLVFFLVIRPLVLRKRVHSNLMIIGNSVEDIRNYSEWIIENRNLAFTVSNRLLCNSIDSKWLSEFDRILNLSEIHEILLLPGMEIDPNFSKFIHYCEDLKIHINWIPLDSGNMGYWLIPSQQEGIPFLTFENNRISLPWRIVKRIFDIIFSCIIMIFLSPVFFLISFVVLISSGWPIFYSQTRVGFQGKKFKFYKFRSMVKDADKIVGQIENIHEKDHVLFKNPHDPRVTPIGRILRKYSLDELPQFLNVLNNTMSVVGPRPALPKEVNAYNSIYERRLNAKPGITGPWQISGRSDLDLGTSISLDLNYMTNWSFSRDLWIIFATVGAIFKGKGAY